MPGWSHIGIWKLIGSLSLIVLIMLYISDRCFSLRWQGLSKPISLLEVLREWLIYMLLFGGLIILLQKVLDSACWTVCVQVIETMRRP